MIPEYQTKLLSVETVARATKRFRFTKPAEWTFQPGQFLSLECAPKVWRAYSIASHPDEAEIELLIRIVPGGAGSTALDKAQVGGEFTFRGGFGHFVLSENTEAELVFCCTGTGIAPFRSMIQAEAKQKNPRKILVYYGGRDADDIAYLDEIATWAPEQEIKLAFSQEENLPDISEADVSAGRVTRLLGEAKFGPRAEFYICGNGDMVVDVRKLLDSKSIPKERIFQERFN